MQIRSWVHLKACRSSNLQMMRSQLLDHLGVRRAVVGGISLGAVIALRLAVHYPERVSELIIARPAWISEAAPENLKIYLDVAELLAQYGSEQGLERLQATERYRRVMKRISGQCGVDAELLYS